MHPFKRKTFLFLYLSLIFIFNTDILGQDDIISFLPQKGDCGDWKPVGVPEHAVGEDLFLLINGGAEIYHEYGFNQAVLQEYQNDNQKSINVEIYEMIDAAGAFGIYSFKTGIHGKPVAIGQDAFLEDYYLNFWKDKWLVTLIGFDAEHETIDGIFKLSSAIDNKIIQNGTKPGLIKLLVPDGLNDRGVKYVKGNLALSKYYKFGSADVFGAKEGVIGDYGQFSLYIFRYDDAVESEKWFHHAKNKIMLDAQSMPGDTTGHFDHVSLQSDQDRIDMKFYRNYIIIALGSAPIEGITIISKVQLKINDNL